jgi:hypothetical protein
MKAVKAYFPDYKKHDQHGAGQSDGQSRHVNQGKNLIFTDVSKGYSKEIPPHNSSVDKVKTVFMPQSLFL